MARRSPLGGVKQKTRRHTHLVTGKAACGRAGPGGAMQPLQRVEAKEEGDERTGGHRVAQEVGREREDGGGSGRVVLRSQPSGGFRWVRMGAAACSQSKCLVYNPHVRSKNYQRP